MRIWRKRSQWWVLAMTAGGSLFALQGCDPAVRDTVLNGVGSAATGLAGTFIQAWIESLQADAEDPNAATTVQAVPAFEQLIFA